MDGRKGKVRENCFWIYEGYVREYISGFLGVILGVMSWIRGWIFTYCCRGDRRLGGRRFGFSFSLVFDCVTFFFYRLFFCL